jgi:hypothetical protein
VVRWRAIPSLVARGGGVETYRHRRRPPATDRDTVDSSLLAFRRIPSSYPAVPLARVHGQRGPQASVGYLESTLLTNASLEYTRLLQSAAGILLMAGLTVGFQGGGGVVGGPI